MDHEFSTNPLEDDLVGWDWFSVQLENKTELMAYFLRKKNGGFSDFSSGTFVTADGEKIHLRRSDMSIEELDYWKSESTGAVYPSEWELKIFPVGLTLDIATVVSDQEMLTPETTSVNYWEGVISANGVLRGEQVMGSGFAELTGYAGKLDAPM
jgi:predicted secreted hydrolase